MTSTIMIVPSSGATKEVSEEGRKNKYGLSLKEDREGCGGRLSGRPGGRGGHRKNSADAMG